MTATEQFFAGGGTLAAGAGGSAAWCKTFDANISFPAGTDEVRQRVAGLLLAAEHMRTEQPSSLFKPFVFMLVEHPFVRVARFYRDCLQRANEASPFGPLAADIIEASAGGDGPDDFKQLLEFITDRKSQQHAMVRYWQPYSVRCQPCRVQYDAIIMMEPKKGMHSRQLEWEQELTKLAAMFENVGEEVMDRLVGYYQDDLMLFNYRVDRFYKEVYKNFESKFI